MATISSPSKDEEEMPGVAERCLKEIEQWPQIMKLLTTEKVPVSQLRESFETLSRIIQQVSDSYPEHNSTASDIIQKVLNVHIAHVYRALYGSSPAPLIMSALNLLVAMVTYSQQAARDVMAAVSFKQVLMALVNRVNIKVEDDIRSCCMRLAMAFFVSADNNVIKQMLTNPDFLKSFFMSLGNDRASNIKLILVTLTQYLVCNPAVSKTEKLHILNNFTLQQVAALYRWKDASEDKLEAQTEVDFQTLEIRQLCHQFLLTVTCDLMHGITFFDSSLGLSGKNCNPVLLKFLLGLPSATDDEMIRELVVSILRTCPDLLNHYLTTCKLSFHPRPSPSWLVNMKFLEEILSGQSLVPSALKQARNTSAGHKVQLAMVNTVPTVLSPVLLSQAVKHSSSIVSCRILEIIKLILRRAHQVIRWLSESGQTAVISRYQQAFIKVLPDVDTYINLLHKTLDRPLDTEESHQAVKKQEPGNTTPETDQATTVDLPPPKKEELLTVLLDVLCAYQQTIPLSFTQTMYDFSHLPHLIQHAESVLQSATVEERCIALLLAFPECKLRGFKEVRGHDGSTVLLLLKQLSSSASKSDLHALKIKLLHKFIKETGLFAETEWEIALWLDVLATFSQDEANQIVSLFYKSLTQAIRNPYPFNDRVIDAMSHAHAVQQSGREDKDTKAVSSPDVLALLAHAASCDLDGGDIIAGSENQPTSLAPHAEPLPCSALLPSALEVFIQLEQHSQSLFGQYVSSVALSILDRQENPVSICLLLHQHTHTDGSNIQQDISWQGVMKYYAMWLPSSCGHSDKTSAGPLMGKAVEKTRTGWSNALHASLMQGIELSSSDVEILLHCDKKELLQMTRQLLMYIHTLHITLPKTMGVDGAEMPDAQLLSAETERFSAIAKRLNALQNVRNGKMLVVLPSYLMMLENVLEYVHSEDNLQEKHSAEEAQNAVHEGSPLSDSNHEVIDEWWTDMASLVLQHAAFGHSARGPPKASVTSGKPHRLNVAVTACFFKCLRLIKQHLPSSKLKPLLQPVIRDSFQNVLNLVTDKREKKVGDTKTQELGGVHRRALELFEEMCVYGDDVHLCDAVSVLIRTLSSQKNSATSSGKKQQRHLRTMLCHVLEIMVDRRNSSELQRLTSTATATTGITQVLNECDASSLVELAHRFGCDRMTSLLSKLVETNPQLTTSITHSIFTSWLNDLSEVKSHLLSLLVKHSKMHSQWFEDWCKQSSTRRLSDNKGFLLPVVITYCSQSSLSAGNQIISIVHATYWSWLEDWILHHEEQEKTNEGDQSKMTLLTRLLMYSPEDAVCKYLQSFIRKGQEKRYSSFSRFQLKSCQLAVERLASHVLDHETRNILQGVIIVCLQSLVKIIKMNPGDSASEVKGHLLSTSAIAKALDKQLLSVSPPLIQVWKSLVRNGLKHCFRSAGMLQLLASLVKLIYSAPGVDSTTEGFDRDLWRYTAGTLLPLPVVYQIVLSHSLFLPTLLEVRAGDKCEVKESMVMLMLTMIEQDPQCCHEAHYAVLVGAYNATLSLTDTIVLTLMRLYQLNQAAPSDYKPTTWGDVAVLQYPSVKALGNSLWQQPSMKEILKQLDADTLRDSAFHFPLHRKLQIPYDHSASSISSQLYDPCFLFALFSNLLAPECVVDCSQFIETNAFALTLAGLNSFDADMRQAAYHIMASLLEHMEGARFRGRREVYYLLQCLKNSITKPNMRVPSMLSVFVARAAALMLTPEHFMYPTVVQYLLIKPQLQMTAVPLFSRLFYSCSFMHEEECLWMLTLLLDGMRESSDVILYNKSSVFTTLMACYQSRLASKRLKNAILSVLDRAFDMEETKDSLTKRLLPCLQAAVASQESCSEEHYSERHTSVMDLMHKLHQQYEDKSHQMCSTSTSHVPAPITRSVIEYSLTPIQLA